MGESKLGYAVVRAEEGAFPVAFRVYLGYDNAVGNYCGKEIGDGYFSLTAGENAAKEHREKNFLEGIEISVELESLDEIMISVNRPPRKTPSDHIEKRQDSPAEDVRAERSPPALMFDRELQRWYTVESP